jgi:hypothetical protein
MTVIQRFSITDYYYFHQSVAGIAKAYGDIANMTGALFYCT